MEQNGFFEIGDQALGTFAGLLARPVAGFRASIEFQPNRFIEGRAHHPAWGPWLVPAEDPGATEIGEYWEQPYPVFTVRRCHDLHRRFARLGRYRRSRDNRVDRAILGFANTYGWLGTPDERWHLEPRKRNSFIAIDCQRGEPFTLWRRAVYEAAALVALWDLVRNGRRDEIAKYVAFTGRPHRVGVFLAWKDGRLVTDRSRRRVDWRAPTSKDEPETVADERAEDRAYRFHAFPKLAGPRPDVVEVARLALYDRVNEQLAGRVSPQLRAERSPGESLMLHPHSLLAAVYLYFARELTGRSAPGTSCANPRCDRTIDTRWGRRYCDDACRDEARRVRDREKRIAAP